jgi:DNA polymerase-4
VFVSSGAADILHADLDSFYASVEQRDDPSLRGRPVIVGGGVVLAASYEAKAYGVRTAMGGRQAKQLCPQAIVVPPRMSAYSQASADVFEVFHDTTPLVEPLSVDEAFLDVSGLARVSGTPVQIGARLREQVRERVGLPITVGIARTKFLAKVASQEGKPDGLLLVPPDRELAFLHPLPVRRLWGVGAKTADKLHAHGIRTVADVAELSESMLGSIVGGGMGHQLFALSHNIDRRRVVTGVRRRSVGAQRALGRAGNTMSETEIDAVVVNLVDRITRRMRTSDRTGRTVVLRLRFDDFSRVTRSHTLPRATASSDAILSAARILVATAAPLIAERGLTLVGFAVSNIDRDGAQQLELSFDAAPDRLAIDSAVDEVRRRFGNASVMRGVLLGRDQGLEMPMLPD